MDYYIERPTETTGSVYRISISNNQQRLQDQYIEQPTETTGSVYRTTKRDYRISIIIEQPTETTGSVYRTTNRDYRISIYIVAIRCCECAYHLFHGVDVLLSW